MPEVVHPPFHGDLHVYDLIEVEVASGPVQLARVLALLSDDSGYLVKRVQDGDYDRIKFREAVKHYPGTGAAYLGSFGAVPLQ